MVVIMQNTQEKANLQKIKANAKKIRKVHMYFVPGKNGGHISNSLGDRIFEEAIDFLIDPYY